MPCPGLILLAAGGSSRMGRPKLLLPWGNTTLLQHACETALKTDCSPVIVVLGCEANASKRILSGLSIITVVNDHWKKGLGTSIAAGVKKLEAEKPGIPGALIMLADQPALSVSLLKTLLARWSPPVWPIAATTLQEGEGGVPAIFDRSFFNELGALEQDRGARAIIAREKDQTLLVNPDCSLIDVDTPESYQEHKPWPCSQSNKWE